MALRVPAVVITIGGAPSWNIPGEFLDWRYFSLDVLAAQATAVQQSYRYLIHSRGCWPPLKHLDYVVSHTHRVGCAMKLFCQQNYNYTEQSTDEVLYAQSNCCIVCCRQYVRVGPALSSLSDVRVICWRNSKY